MKSSSVIIILLIAFAVSMYFLGKKNGTTELKATIINNALLVKQIAELSSLEVSGTTTTKLTNVGENAGVWESMKNYFAENTLQVSIPYIAKFGVDVSKGNISINKNDSSFIINLPPCKMLSFQLQLDRLETMNQTGLFAHTTVADMRLAQQQLYAAANQQLSTNAGYIEKAKAHIAEIYSQYYQPLGYKVVCTFTQP